MVARPQDTSPEAWSRQLAALTRLGAEGRVQVAIELSEAVRAIHLEGILARHPGWRAPDAVRHLVKTQFGIELPRR